MEDDSHERSADHQRLLGHHDRETYAYISHERNNMLISVFVSLIVCGVAIWGTTVFSTNIATTRASSAKCDLSMVNVLSIIMGMSVIDYASSALIIIVAIMSKRHSLGKVHAKAHIFATLIFVARCLLTMASFGMLLATAILFWSSSCTSVTESYTPTNVYLIVYMPYFVLVTCAAGVSSLQNIMILWTNSKTGHTTTQQTDYDLLEEEDANVAL